MERNRSIFVNGQEVDIDDWNAVTNLTSAVQDLLVQELFRPYPMNHSSAVGPYKGIIPFGFYGSNGVDPANAGVVKTTGSTSPSLLVYPFRAVLGSLQGAPDVTPSDAWRGVRTVVCASLTPGDDNLATKITIAPTVANHRVDLVYCKVSLSANTTTENRYVRDPVTEVITHPSLTVEASDSFQILVAIGTESGSPVPPGLPLDSGGDYYIPLAYIWIAHPGFGSVSVTHIDEIAPVIPIAHAIGAASLLAGNQQYSPTGAMMTATQWTVTGTRPETYIPPSMMGKTERIFAFRWDSTPKSPGVGATVLIDNSIDWRKRAFKWDVMSAKNSGAATFSWSQSASGSTVNLPSAFSSGSLGATRQAGFGQSFVIDAAAFSLPNSSTVIALSSATLSQIAGGVNVLIHVNMTDGNLYLTTSGDPTINMFVWLEATGPFANAS